MTLHTFPDVEQGTEEWHDQRRGMVTASVVGSLLSVGKLGAIGYGCPKCHAFANDPCVSLRPGKPATTEAAKPIKTLHPERAAVAEANKASSPLVIEVANNETSRSLTKLLVAEEISGWTDETFTSPDMMRGILIEPIARAGYAEYTGQSVTKVGFMTRDLGGGATLGASPDGLVGDRGGLEIKAPRAKTHVATVLAGEVPLHHMAQVQACLLVSGRDWWDFVSYCAGLPMWMKRVTPDPRWHSAIAEAVTQFEQTKSRMLSEFYDAVDGLPMTERLPFEEEIRI